MAIASKFDSHAIVFFYYSKEMLFYAYIKWEGVKREHRLESKTLTDLAVSV